MFRLYFPVHGQQLLSHRHRFYLKSCTFLWFNNMISPCKLWELFHMKLLLKIHSFNVNKVFVFLRTQLKTSVKHVCKR